MANCQWAQHVPKGEQPRGSDAGTVVRDGTGWRCRHSARPGDAYCTIHEQADLRRVMILDWAVYQLSRRRDSFAGHAYDWAVRKEVSRLPLDRLRAALDLIVEDRARDGAKRGVLEVSDLVRAVASVQRERSRERRQASGCPTCFGTGWRIVFDRYQAGMTGAVACSCRDGGSRSSEAQERGRPVCNADNMPRRWTVQPPQPVAAMEYDS